MCSPYYYLIITFCNNCRCLPLVASFRYPSKILFKRLGPTRRFICWRHGFEKKEQYFEKDFWWVEYFLVSNDCRARVTVNTSFSWAQTDCRLADFTFVFFCCGFSGEIPENTFMKIFKNVNSCRNFYFFLPSSDRRILFLLIHQF